MHAPIHNAAIHNALTIQSTNTQSCIQFNTFREDDDSSGYRLAQALPGGVAGV